MDNNSSSKTGYWITGIILVIIVIGVWIWSASSNPSVSQTGATTTPDQSGVMIRPYGTATIGLGQTATFQGIAITPISVAKDTRCSSSAQCVTPGTVQVVVRSDLASGASEQDTMTLGSTTQVDMFAITLTDVAPQPQAGSTIPSQNYQFTFDVHQSASGVGLQGKG
ncbi:MAG: hypothetical protein KGI79_03475 [Patescibacteria group bacterium]|nr:hypothetical protein [Patescibacteria group bacterium]MDE2116908.1 hypothetical protein [Patescibacteria group bacterium]